MHESDIAQSDNDGLFPSRNGNSTKVIVSKNQSYVTEMLERRMTAIQAELAEIRRNQHYQQLPVWTNSTDEPARSYADSTYMQQRSVMHSRNRTSETGANNISINIQPSITISTGQGRQLQQRPVTSLETQHPRPAGGDPATSGPATGKQT